VVEEFAMRPIFSGPKENSNKDYSIAEWVKEKGGQSVIRRLTLLDN
jgi:hypothetical protein